MVDGQRSRRRSVLIVLAAVAAAAVFAGGWFAAKQFESPAQRAASASAPKALPVVAEVQKGTLGESFTTTATIAPSTKLSGVLTAAGSGQSYVTARTAASGSALAAGDVAVEVNGAPIFAFTGAFPFYRDLSEGDTGPDVRQLQEGLAAAGYDLDATGTFGTVTANAVGAIFRAHGYTAPTTTAAAASGQATSSATPARTAAPSSSTTDTQNTAPYFPLADLVSFTSLPGVVDSTPAEGTAITSSSAITIELGTDIGTGSVATTIASSLTAGMNGTATKNGTSVPVQIRSVSQATSSGSNSTMTVAAASGKTFPSSWTHESVLLTIELTKSSADALIVPTNAIATDGSGGGEVLVKHGAAGFREVRVKELGELDGKAAVEPDLPSELVAGDEVKVG